MGAINTILTFLCLTFLSLVNCTDPGYVKNQVDFYDLIRVIESTQLCPDCETVRTSRSRHCAVCHRCVERFDHHCPWVNNCVGVKNHNYFICYIATQLLIILVAFTGCLWALIVFSKNQFSYNDFTVNHGLLIESLQKPACFYSLVLLLLVITALFSFPLIILVMVQLGNFFNGRTTMERFGRSTTGGGNDVEAV
jgi:palmitoyltransferase ZDHHC13/17